MMISTMSKTRSIAFAGAAIFIVATAVNCVAQGKTPIIFIPGLTGSQLINSKTGQIVWFKTRRVRTDDLRLPIGLNLTANRDSLVAGDVLRSVKSTVFPRTDIYGGFLTALEQQGYREARWDLPPARGYEDTVYVFPYDWRRDIVETSQILIRKIENLKRVLGRPNLKFDIVAHSMGGLIAKYAAMYGAADLPRGEGAPTLTWAGSRHIARIIMLGPPNQGSMSAFKALINGFDIIGLQVKLPFVQNLSKFDVFTIPTSFELLPEKGAFRAFDDELKPLDLDFYDPKTWSTYGWNPVEDKNFQNEFSAVEQKNAQRYFTTLLDRTRRLHEALDVSPDKPSPVAINVIGADCKETLDAVVITKKKDGEWWTVTKSDSFTNAAGRKISSEELKKVLYAQGDGIITKQSLDGVRPQFVCEAHDKLASNVEVQALVLKILAGGK